MEAGEFEDWKRLHREEPWGGPAEDERLRILLSGTANLNGGRTTPADFAFAWAPAEAAAPQRILLDFRTGAQLLAGCYRPR
jgi:hypothetical protein